jgi:hypothetical protein
VAFRVLIQGCEHDGQYSLNIVANQIAEVLIIPEVQGTFGDLAAGVSSRLSGVQTSATHLEMGTGHGFCQLIEQRLLDFGELCGVHHLKYVFHLIKKHDLFCAVHLWPVAEKAQDHLQCRLVNH